MFAQLNYSYLRNRPLKVWSRLLSYFLFEGRPLTTRGRWINPLVFGLFNLEKRLPQMKKVIKPVFILGTGRSGTTILGTVLSMHREVGFLNEPKALWHAIYPGEDLIGSYSTGKASYRLDADDVSPESIRHAHRLFGAYLTATFSKRVVDKYPELLFRVPFVKKIFPDAKFLFLVRNGWDTCSSIEKWSGKLGKTSSGDVHDWWGVNRRKWALLVEQLVPEHADLSSRRELMSSWSRHTDMAAVEWIVSMREGLRLMREMPNDVFRVDYEELCMRPRGLLEEITGFLGLAENDERFLNYGESVLRPVPSVKQFPLDPAIDEEFRRTMRAVGYEI